MTQAYGYTRLLNEVRERANACGRQAEEITIVAVSKNHPLISVEKAYQEGVRDFGESRIQEALTKISSMPGDCRWHLVGSLQSKKVNKAVSSFQLIHSVDTPELVRKISHASEKQGVVTSILLQINTTGEISKHGMPPDAWEQALPEVNALHNVRVEGLMTMAPLTEDRGIIRKCFSTLRLLRDAWRGRMRDPASFQQLSMGMSHDFPIAIEEGATLLRIGTAIFGDLSV